MIIKNSWSEVLFWFEGLSVWEFCEKCLLWLLYVNRNPIEKPFSFYLWVQVYAWTRRRVLRQGQIGDSQGHSQKVCHQNYRYPPSYIDLNGTIKQNELLIIEREIKIHTTIDHPHIIKLWDTLRDDRSIYMVMDYASNGSLFRYHSQKLSQG